MYAYNLWLMTPDRDLPPFNDSWRADVPRILQEGYGFFPHGQDCLRVAAEGLRIIEGQEEPFVQGWLPMGHGIRGVRPIPTPTFVMEGPGIQDFLYVFYPVPEGEVRGWALPGLRPETGVAAEIRFPDGRTYHLLFPLDPKQEWNIEGRTLFGEFLLLRRWA